MLPLILSTRQNSTDMSRKLIIRPMDSNVSLDYGFPFHCATPPILIRYAIDFRHDRRTTIVPYESDKYIYIEYVCHGRYPVTNFGINASTYSMVVRSCKHAYVTLICPEDGKLPDYVPRNHQFECRFNCKRLRHKSFICVRNNVAITVELEMMNLNFGYTTSALKLVNQPYVRRAVIRNATPKEISLWQNMEKYKLETKSSRLKYPKTEIFYPILADALLVLSIPMAILFFIIRKYQIQQPRIKLTRNRKFDAYVCYKVDSDGEYAEDIILQEFQENCETPFKIYIHRDNFQPGRTIKRNIHEAIQNSNSAIIVMSQDFVDSVWCREEFADCYVENMNDPAFQLFVILTQPKEDLVNLSEYMTSFLAQRTYLKKDDPNLFRKISDYLLQVKQDQE